MKAIELYCSDFLKILTDMLLICVQVEIQESFQKCVANQNWHREEHKNTKSRTKDNTFNIQNRDQNCRMVTIHNL